MARRRRRESAPEDERRKILHAYAKCFGSAEGQLVLADLERRYQKQSSIEALAQGSDVLVNRVLVREGQRLVYLHIIQQMEAAEADARGESTAEPEWWDPFGDNPEPDQRSE